MANIRSQIKRNRQNDGRRLRNKAVRSALKTSAKRVRSASAGGEAEAAASHVRAAARELDKAVSKGALHKRTAARRKSRLAKAAATSASGELLARRPTSFRLSTHP